MCFVKEHVSLYNGASDRPSEAALLSVVPSRHHAKLFHSQPHLIAPLFFFACAVRRLGAKTLKSDPPTLGAAVPPAPAPSAAADIASPAGGSAGVAEPAPSS